MKELKRVRFIGGFIVSVILVLEDDIDLNQTMSISLEKEGYQVFSAFSYNLKPKH